MTPGARVGCFVAILAAVCTGHSSAVWKEQPKVVKKALPEGAEAAIRPSQQEQVADDQGEKLSKVNGLVNKWDKLDKKIKARKESADTLAAAIRVMKSLKPKKAEADKEYGKEMHLYAHTGGHPTDHKKDLPMPDKLEIAAAQKNVMDLRYRRAQAQVALLRHQAEKAGAIDGTGSSDADSEQDEEEEKTEAQKVKDIQKKEKQAAAKQERALKEFEDFKKNAKKAKMLERTLRKQKAVAKALAETAKKTSSAKLQREKIQLETAATEAKAARTQAEITQKETARLSYKEVTRDAEDSVKNAVKAGKESKTQGEEIAKLKQKLQDSEKAVHKAEASAKKAKETAAMEKKQDEVATSALKNIQKIDSKAKEENEDIKEINP